MAVTGAFDGMGKHVSVIGDGGWGTALALVLLRNGHEVTVWGPFPDYVAKIKQLGENKLFLPDVRLPGESTWPAARRAAVANADVVVLAVPTKFFRAVAGSFSDLLPDACSLVSVAKGLDQETHQRMSQVAEEVLGHGPVAALSGPSHAEEVARRIPTAVTLACTDPERCRSLQDVFANPRFRVYVSTDIIGIELGGALKNVIAVAVGVSDGIGFGDNSRAALITRGLAEMTRFGCALDANASTFAGLSGMGDLIVTCTSRLSRNRAVGERLGRGEKIRDILESMKQVAEGVVNCRSARDLAQQHGIDMPITDQVYQIIHENKSPEQAVSALLSRDLKAE